MKKIFLLILSCIIIFSNIVKAQEKNNRNYTRFVIENYEDQLVLIGFVAGIGEAYMMNSVIIKKDYSIQNFCPPNNLSFTSDDYFSILKQQYLRQGRKNLPTVITLYLGLKNTFPCS